MPAGAIERDDSMGAHRHAAADFGQVQIHRRGVGVGQDERRAGVARRADGPENIGPLVPAIARRGCRVWPKAWSAYLAGRCALRLIKANRGFSHFTRPVQSLDPQYQALDICTRARETWHLADAL